MMKCRLAVVASVVVLCMGRVVTASCVVDADCDNGDTCSVPDVCTAGTCVLGGGGDANGDLVCDAELDPHTVFNLTKMIVKRKKSNRGDNSVAKGGGDLFVSGSPAGAFTGTNGVSIRVRDALAGIPPAGDGVDVTISWAPADCTTTAGGVLVCQSPTGHAQARFKPNPVGPGQYIFNFKIKGLGDLTGPFFGPVRVVISQGPTLHSSDTIQDCALILSGIRCRAP